MSGTGCSGQSEVVPTPGVSLPTGKGVCKVLWSTPGRQEASGCLGVQLSVISTRQPPCRTGAGLGPLRSAVPPCWAGGLVGERREGAEPSPLTCFSP